MPVDTTTPRPRPERTSEPMKATLRRSATGTSAWPGAGATTPAHLSAGSFSPVSDDSSMDSSTVSNSRRSAGTRSPPAMTTTSPGTRSLASMSPSDPSRSTLQWCGASLDSAASDWSDLYSCTHATVVTIMTACVAGGAGARVGGGAGGVTGHADR